MSCSFYEFFCLISGTVTMETLKWFRDFKVLEEITTMTSILTDNEISFTKRTKSTESDIFEISDRGRDEREHYWGI